MSKDESSIQPWKLLASEMALDHPWYRVRRDTVKLPDGKVIDDYFLSLRPEVVLIFPITADKEVVLVRQYKHGAEQALLEFPGGIFADEDELAVVAAARELQEETGYTADHYRSLGAVWDDASKQNNRLHLFLAEGAQLTDSTQFDETEFIEVVLVPMEALPQMIIEGEICSGGALALALKAMLVLE